MHNIRTNGTKLGFTSLCEIWDNADANRGRWGVGFHICIRPANDPPTHPHPTPTYPIPPPPPPCPTAGTPWRPLCTVCTGNARQTNAARASSALGKLDALCALWGNFPWTHNAELSATMVAASGVIDPHNSWQMHPAANCSAAAKSMYTCHGQDQDQERHQHTAFAFHRTFLLCVRNHSLVKR